MNRLTLVVGVLLLASLAGCLPEEKVVWSPDGRRAAVIAPDGLYLCDGDGRLSPCVAPDVKAAAWTHDSKRLIVIRDTKSPVKTWKEAAALIDEETAKEVAAAAAALRQEILAFSAPPEKFEPKIFAQAGMTKGLLAALYLRDNQPEGLPEKLGKLWEDLKEMENPVYAIEVGEVSGDGAKFLPVAKTLSAPGYPRISPDGRHVAYVTNAELPEGQWALMVMPLAGGRPRMAARNTAIFADWSGDGRCLVYARATGPSPVDKGNLRLGTISRLRVCDDQGGLLGKFPLAQDVAGLVFQETLKVRGLRDGRILFAAAPVQLPCTSADMPTKAALFAAAPEELATLIRILPRDVEADVPQGVNFFELSPDQRSVAIPGPQGVSVVVLATGALQKVYSAKDQTLVMVPAWRSATELCFSVDKGDKIGSPNRPEVVLWSPQGSRLLSASWPDAMVEGMLKKPGENQTPPPPPLPTSATQPQKKEEGKKAP